MMSNQPPKPDEPTPEDKRAEADVKATMMKAQADVKSTQLKTQAKIGADRQKIVADAKNKQLKTIGEAAMMGLAPTTGSPGEPPRGV